MFLVLLLHHIHKSVKQVRCILWTCAGFWMELYCEYILTNIFKSLISLIINISQMQVLQPYCLMCFHLQHNHGSVMIYNICQSLNP